MKLEHYNNDYQTVDIAKDWNLSGPLFNVLKYIQRRGRKDNNTADYDLLKAIWYLVYELTSNKNMCNDVMTLLGTPENTTATKNICACPECKKFRSIQNKTKEF